MKNLVKKVLSGVMAMAVATSMMSVAMAENDVVDTSKYFTLDFTSETDLRTDYGLRWSSTQNIPTLAKADGKTVGKIQTPITGVAYYTLNAYDMGINGNYVIEIPIKRDKANRTELYLTNGSGTEMMKLVLASNTWHLNGTSFGTGNGAGAWDKVYIVVNNTTSSYTVYVNNESISATGTLPESEKTFLSGIRFGVNNLTEGESSDVYVDYVKTYPASELVIPKLEVNFDGTVDASYKPASTSWSNNAAKKYFLPALGQNGVGTITSADGATGYYAWYVGG